MRKDMKNVLPDPFQKIHFKIPGHEYRKKKKKISTYARAAAQSYIFVKSETC